MEKWIKDSSCKLLQQFDSGIQVITIYINVITFSLQAKAFLDKKTSEDKSFSDFLQRCLESPFSRKLDLWSYLDVPRSRLVKYPLLLKQVLK